MSALDCPGGVPRGPSTSTAALTAHADTEPAEETPAIRSRPSFSLMHAVCMHAEQLPVSTDPFWGFSKHSSRLAPEPCLLQLCRAGVQEHIKVALEVDGMALNDTCHRQTWD